MENVIGGRTRDMSPMSSSSELEDVHATCCTEVLARASSITRGSWMKVLSATRAKRRAELALPGRIACYSYRPLAGTLPKSCRTSKSLLQTKRSVQRFAVGLVVPIHTVPSVHTQGEDKDRPLHLEHHRREKRTFTTRLRTCNLLFRQVLLVDAANHCSAHMLQLASPPVLSEDVSTSL